MDLLKARCYKCPAEPKCEPNSESLRQLETITHAMLLYPAHVRRPLVSVLRIKSCQRPVQSRP